MALFGRTTEKEKEAAQPARAGASVVPTDGLSSVLLSPRVTEKAALLSGQGTYVFIVRRDASKYDVKAAIKALYNVTPEKVRVVNRPPRKERSRARARTRTRAGMKKAYVTLKDGDRIELA